MTEDLTTGTVDHLTQLIDRAEALASGRRRVLIGLVGAPGAGKSTLAAALAERFGPTSAVLGMDGFHLANRELARLGRAGRKGAPDTFDAAGFVALLHRVRTQPETTIYAPSYERSIEEAIAGALPLHPLHRVIWVEGNYLLLDRDGWAPVAELLDECWYLEPDADLRRSRLIARHQAHGRDRTDAESWAWEVDEPNAELIAAGRSKAALVIDPDRLGHGVSGTA